MKHKILCLVGIHPDTNMALHTDILGMAIEKRSGVYCDHCRKKIRSLYLEEILRIKRLAGEL